MKGEEGGVLKTKAYKQQYYNTHGMGKRSWLSYVNANSKSCNNYIVAK